MSARGSRTFEQGMADAGESLANVGQWLADAGRRIADAGQPRWRTVLPSFLFLSALDSRPAANVRRSNLRKSRSKEISEEG